jgi:hypothetical protein
MNALRGILFDWCGTLFHDEDDVDWVRISAASVGRDISVAQAQELLARVAVTSEHPDVIDARRCADCSLDLNRAATLLEFRLAECDDELALAIWQRDGSPGVGLPCTDVPEVLAELKHAARASAWCAICITIFGRYSSALALPTWSTPTRFRSNMACRNPIRVCSRLRERFAAPLHTLLDGQQTATRPQHSRDLHRTEC